MYPLEVRVRALRLLGQGRSLSSVSREVGVSRFALREWRDRGPDPLGLPRTCFACGRREPDAAAYAALLGYYLGDGCISKARRTYVLRISCDRTYPGIIADIDQVVGRVHEGARICHVDAPGVVVVQNCWNHWPCLFPQHGPGRKHQRALFLADWQKEIVDAHPGDFLRGLFHSDGCRSNNWATRPVGGVKKRYDYPRWQFVNRSDDIRRWCCDALDLLGVPWRQNNAKTISVSTRAGVSLLDEVVGLKT